MIELLIAALEKQQAYEAPAGSRQGTADIRTAADWVSSIHDHADRAMDPEDSCFEDAMLEIAALALAAIQTDRLNRVPNTEALMPALPLRPAL